MHAWKLLPEPERLTELYFTDSNELPTKYAPGHQQVVAFTIHNLEYRPTTYTYQVTMSNQDGSQSQTLQEETLTLKHNEYHHEFVTISTPDIGPTAKVEVKLVNTNESIHYLVGRVEA